MTPTATWRDAALQWDVCGEPYPAMYCRWREAEALLAQRGERQRAKLAMGHTDRQIAEQLFISRKTASVHVSNLLRKPDVSNRVEAGKTGQRLSQPRPAPD